MITPEELWQNYMENGASNIDTDQRYSAWHFCDNQRCADELLQLVLNGEKVATSSALWIYKLSGEKPPSQGDISIITNWNGDAKCIIITTDISIIPFAEVDEEFAKQEGEGDKSLEYWRNVHWDYFAKELSRYDYVPHARMPIVCEKFNVVFNPDT